MRRCMRAETQRKAALKWVEAGRRAEDEASRHGVTKRIIYAGKTKYCVMELSAAGEAAWFIERLE
jgi:hypothetical protein